MEYTQDNRLLSITTPLGKDVLLLQGFKGADGLSTLFGFELDLLSQHGSIPFSKIIGKNVTVSLQLAGGDPRYFNGIIAAFTQTGGGGDTEKGPRFSGYRAFMVPWLWLLDKTTDTRIFQNLTVPDIVEKIFKEKGMTDFRMTLRSYPKREYCVQYRESDLNFISRLLEEEGIFYFFEHQDGKHILVIADAASAHKPCPNQETARCGAAAGGLLSEDIILTMERREELRAGLYSLRDFNFEIPNNNLEVSVPARPTVGPGEREYYLHPGIYRTRSEGDRLVRLRIEEEEARITRIAGSGTCRAFTSGYRFLLDGSYRMDMNNKEYVLTSVAHRAYQSWEQGGGVSYGNTFTCMPYETPFRPPRTTPKPLVHGSQTAIVVGPPGEEIYTDEHGRIKVQFHWDREGKKDDKSSWWIRVSQPWAGQGWGAIAIPRIGHEVVVDFLEGDPDRPLITGSVYNAVNTPPYPLPGEKTKSTLKSDSSKGSGGFNEIRFEDKKGSEEVFVHGQKDYNIVVENNTTHTTVKTHTIKADEIFVEGTTKVVIKAASSSIEIDASGITIKGSPLVKINP